MLLLAAVFFAVSAWGSGIAGTAAEFVFYRVVGGIAVGAASVMSPAYVSEVTPARYRDRMTTVQHSLYAGLALLSAVFVVRMVHETKGVELEDMAG